MQIKENREIEFEKNARKRYSIAKNKQNMGNNNPIYYTLRQCRMKYISHYYYIFFNMEYK